MAIYIFMKFSLFAKKSLGQHFLNSTHVLEQIIGAAHIERGQTVLEIGPGTGMLTRALLNAGAHVITIEKDARAIPVLKETFSPEISQGLLEIIEGDVLEIPNDQFYPAKAKVPISKKSSRFSLVANIPYYITGAILEKFLEHGPRPSHMVLLVQKEVADRIVARDGRESILSISVKAFGTPSIAAKVPPGAFTPPPSVDSAILVIEHISDSLFEKYGIKPEHLFRLVKAGFAHKRKVLIRNLESVAHREDIQASWQKYGLDPHVRAENVTLETWFKISQSIRPIG